MVVRMKRRCERYFEEEWDWLWQREKFRAELKTVYFKLSAVTIPVESNVCFLGTY